MRVSVALFFIALFSYLAACSTANQTTITPTRPAPAVGRTAAPQPTATQGTEQPTATAVAKHQATGTILFGGSYAEQSTTARWIFSLDASCIPDRQECIQNINQLIGPDEAGISINEGYDWSPDGSQIVFLSDRDRLEPLAFSLYVMDADGSNQQLLLELPNAIIRNPAWSPDGSWIAFEWVEMGETLDRPSHIGLIRPDGSEHRDLPDAGDTHSLPSWSPYGRMLAFLVNDFTPAEPRMRIIDVADDSVVIEVDTPRAVHATYPPSWSPTGDSVAFAGVVGDIEDIYKLNVETGDIVNLTNDKASDWDPIWSPDGGHIAYSTVGETNADLAVIDLTSGARRLLYASEHLDIFPIWSPDGFYLVHKVASMVTPLSFLHLVALDGSLAMELTGAEIFVQEPPVWSP
jgi:hypothetical protein